MFERYTERARRSIFYARELVSVYGSMLIDTEHVLLGILREDPNVIARFLPSKTNEDIWGWANWRGRLPEPARVGVEPEEVELHGDPVV